MAESEGQQKQPNGISRNLNFDSPQDGQPPPETDEFGYRIREESYGTKRRLKVILMGAGASTLNFLKKAEEQMQNLDIVCYEKNADVGGTWFENRYPGTSLKYKGYFNGIRLLLRYPQRQLPVHLENQALVTLLLVCPRDLGVSQGN
jgi:hypothetical protein